MAGQVNERVTQLLTSRTRAIQGHFADLPPQKFISTTELRVWASTFNVNGTCPSHEVDLRSWLTHPGAAPPATTPIWQRKAPIALFQRRRDNL